jgi:hypothetical protein
LALVALAIALAGSGCGLFDTAQPEPPTSLGLLPPDFALPESTLITLERAIEGKNATNYMLCFADTLIETKGFHAAFDPADLLDYQTATGQPPPSDWVRPQETSFINQFFGSLSGTPVVYLLADPHPDCPCTSNLVWVNRKFRVYVGPSTAAASSIGLQLERVNAAGDWKITYWEDRRDTTSSVQSYGTRRLRGR